MAYIVMALRATQMAANAWQVTQCAVVAAYSITAEDVSLSCSTVDVAAHGSHGRTDGLGHEDRVTMVALH